MYYLICILGGFYDLKYNCKTPNTLLYFTIMASTTRIGKVAIQQAKTGNEQRVFSHYVVVFYTNIGFYFFSDIVSVRL